jgi:hypothetical protein
LFSIILINYFIDFNKRIREFCWLVGGNKLRRRRIVGSLTLVVSKGTTTPHMETPESVDIFYPLFLAPPLSLRPLPFPPLCVSE